MIDEVTYIKEKIFDITKKDEIPRYIRNRWINDNNKCVFIFDGGTDLFASNNLFNEIFNVFHDDFYVILEPDDAWNIPLDFPIKIEFNTYTEYFETICESKYHGMFFQGHLIYTNCFSILLHVIDDDVLIAIGNENDLNKLFHMNLEDNQKLLWDDIQHLSDYHYAVHYWGKDWYKSAQNDKLSNLKSIYTLM